VSFALASAPPRQVGATSRTLQCQAKRWPGGRGALVPEFGRRAAGPDGSSRESAPCVAAALLNVTKLQKSECPGNFPLDRGRTLESLLRRWKKAWPNRPKYPPLISVVVPTRNRSRALGRCLSSLVEQEHPCGVFEIVVVDNGSSDNTHGVVAEAAEKATGPRALYVHEPKRGANRARNAGIERAVGDLILLVDDDVEAPPFGSTRWRRARRDTRKPGASAGPSGSGWRARPRGSAGGDRLGETDLDLGPAECAVGGVYSANMAVTRAALERCGPFDERVEGYGDEEEWEGRQLEAGGSVVYLPGPGCGTCAPRTICA
jgi:hypothetical protein